MSKTTIEERAHKWFSPSIDDKTLRDVIAFAHRERAAALREAADWHAPEQWKLVHMIRAFADAEERLANV